VVVGYAVENDRLPVVEEPTEVSFTGGAHQVGHELGVVDGLFGVVVQVKGAVAGDLPDDLSVANTVVGESGVTRWGSVKVGTGRVRTVGKKS